MAALDDWPWLRDLWERRNGVPAHASRDLCRLFAKYGGKCQYCGIITILTTGRHPAKATRDHVIPRSKGGTDDESNIVLACYGCNQEKANKLPDNPHR